MMREIAIARVVGAVAFLTVTMNVSVAAAESEWLSLCGKCLSPSVTSKSGIGTAQARAEGRISRGDAEGWCQNWEPQTPLQQCVRLQLGSEDAKRVYRASADCTAGKITPIDGGSYTLAGKWTNDVGRGRSRWRDASGRIVGQDNASNGLAISQQWELLCPASTTASRAPTAAAAAPKVAAAPPAGDFAVGQVIEAKFGREWVRGRVTKIRQVNGAKGAELNYDVNLDNGRRGVLPARMVRAAQ